MPFDSNQNEAPSEAKAGWRAAAGQATRRVGKLVYDVVTAPSVLIGAGVSIWSYQTSGTPGLAFNAGIAATSAILRGYESWTGKQTGWPGGVRAVTSTISAGLVAYHSFHDVAGHVQHTAEFVKSTLLPIASNLLAAGAWWTQGIHEKRHQRPKATLDDPFFYAGLCEIPAAISIVGLSARVAPFFAAVGKSMMKKMDDSHIVDSWRDFAVKHVTPARFCAVAYAACAEATRHSNADATVFQLLWTVGFVFWDKNENRDFVPDLMRVVRGHSAVPAP